MSSYNYKFSEDELMQAVGNHLFPDDATITISKNMKGVKTLSFLIYDEYIYKSFNLVNSPKKCKLYIYPMFDDVNDYYNINILVTQYSRYENKSFEMILEGNKPLDQNEFLEIIVEEELTGEMINKEVWIKDRTLGFVDCIAPITNVDITRVELLRKIIQWNLMEAKSCTKCGNPISRFVESNLCADCMAKENVMNTHKSLINTITLE